MNTTNHRDTWERYVAMWKADGAEAKRALTDALTGSCVYTDPLKRTEGHDALVDYMVDFHRQIPGGHFVTKFFLAHHGRSIATWDMVGGNGEKLGEGISYACYGADGRLTEMTGFFEQP